MTLSELEKDSSHLLLKCISGRGRLKSNEAAFFRFEDFGIGYFVTRK